MGIIGGVIFVVVLIIFLWKWYEGDFSTSKAARFDVVEMRLTHALKLYKGRPTVNAEEYDLEVLGEFLDIANDVKEGKI